MSSSSCSGRNNLSGLTLKLIAVITMLIDHLGYAFHGLMPEPWYLAFRLIGRVAMPLFCFLLAEGLFHTRSVRKYIGRLLIFAAVSEVPFDLMGSSGRTPFDFSSQNVYFTLFLALLGVALFDRFLYKNQKLPALLSILAAAGAALLIHADYGAFGVLFVFVFYRFRDDRSGRAMAFTVAVLLFALYQTVTLMPTRGQESALQWALIGLFQLAALIPIHFYNGKKGRIGSAGQWAFYVFYPAHLFVLAMIKLAVH